MGCYRLYKELKNNADAKQQCANDGGRLLLINNKTEFDKVDSLLGKHLLNFYDSLVIHTSVNISSIEEKNT